MPGARVVLKWILLAALAVLGLSVLAGLMATWFEGTT